MYVQYNTINWDLPKTLKPKVCETDGRMSSGVDPSVSVSVGDVTLSYTKTLPLVLDSVNTKLTKGSIYCLLGPSGCGKTSLLKVIDKITTFIWVALIRSFSVCSPRTLVMSMFLLTWRSLVQELASCPSPWLCILTSPAGRYSGTTPAWLVCFLLWSTPESLPFWDFSSCQPRWDQHHC